MKRPPGPRNPPLVGHLAAMRRNPTAFLKKISSYGDLVYFRMANQEVYFVNHPELVREVLVTQQGAFHKSRVLQKAKALVGEGLLTSEDAFHLRQRRLVQPAFHRERLAGYAAAMVELGAQTAESWKSGTALDIHREMARLTLAIVARTLFSANVDEVSDDITESMTAVLELFEIALLPFSELLEKLPLPASRRFRAARQKLDAIIYGIIEERRRTGEDKGDLLSMLILAQDEEGGTGGMTDRQVRDEALTLFLAGHETTAVALTWTWHLLSLHPDAERRFHEEIDRVEPSFEALGQLEYTRAVVAESMRLFPPAWAIGRMAQQEVELGGYAIPKGAIVILSPFVTHRDGRFWTEAEAFQPERFLGADERPKFSYFPFGGGTRVCIGERFAWMEATLLLAVLGRRWRLKDTGARVEPHAVLTLRPRGGLPMMPADRKRSEAS